MKLRTVLISVVVTAALVGGAGYGAYYAAQSRKSPVEVVPVSNVSMGYYAMDSQQVVYGSVTSQVAQTVRLNDDYGIDKIYVQVGDEVKEGTPLFSYDMTLQELELEMQQLELQTNELTLTRLEKELKKLKNTPATASLERERDWFTLTASAEEAPEETDAIIEEETETEGTGEIPDGTDTDGQTSGEPDGVEVDGVEKINGNSAGEPLLPTIENSVLSFEALVLEIQATFLACGDELKADDIGEAVEQAVSYYRKNLADEETTEEEQEDGSVKEIRSYALKDSVKAALSKEEVATLKKSFKTLNEYQVRYVEMLIDEAETEAEELEDAAFLEMVERIGESYDLLATQQQERVENLDCLEELQAAAEEIKARLGEENGTDGADETGTDGSDGVNGSSETGTDGTDGADGSSEVNGSDGADESGENDGTAQNGTEQPQEGVRQNTVAFDVSDGAVTTVNGQDVTNSIAMAEDGKIVFAISLEDGYKLTEVLVDGSIPARKNEASDDPDDYVIEGIQTNDTIVSVRTVQDPDASTPDENRSEDSDGSSGTGEPAEIAEGDGTTNGDNTTSGDGTTNGDGTTTGDETTPGDGETNDNGTTSGDGTTNGDGTTTGDGETNDNGTKPGDGTTSGDGTANGDSTATGDGTTTDGSTTNGDGTTTDDSTANGDDTTSGDGMTTDETPAAGEDVSQKKEYTVTINPGNLTGTYEAGRLVPLQANMDDVTLVFMGWSVAPTSGDPGQVVELNAEDVASGYASFLMPEFDVTATAHYENAPEAIESYTTTFLSNAEMLLAENAAQTYAEQGKDYLTELESAIVFYQQWLSYPMTEILDESQTATPDMEKYQLLDNVRSYLTEQGKEFQVTQLEERYRDLCICYAKALFEAINPSAIDKNLLEKATDAYNQLGNSWRKRLEKQWKNEQADLAEQSGEPWEKNKKGKLIAPDGFLSIGDTLGAYAVIQMYQELLSLPEDTPEEDRFNMALNIWDKYSELNDAQRSMVSSDPSFVDTFRQYGLWTDEPETEFPDYGDFGDFGDFDGEWTYTAEELAEMIEEKEREIENCSLDIRQNELDLRQKQRIVDGKVVKSTMDGTVISIGGPDGDSDEDYFVKVANEAGLYAKGVMSELTLEQINVGDTISGTLITNGTGFTAVIKEVSEYPDPNGQYMGYGQENTNASYYPFYALIDDAEDMEEGEAEIYLSGTAPGDMSAIYLENYFVRTEPDGRTYVYKKGDDGNLTKQYVKTGKKMYGYAVEIADGLTLDDCIAFPYGKDVKEGAKTKDVDRLQNM